MHLLPRHFVQSTAVGFISFIIGGSCLLVLEHKLPKEGKPWEVQGLGSWHLGTGFSDCGAGAEAWRN